MAAVISINYPVVIALDRYGGTFSGGQWAAFQSESVPAAARGENVAAAFFWENPPEPVGVGDTPNEALAALMLAVAK